MRAALTLSLLLLAACSPSDRAANAPVAPKAPLPSQDVLAYQNKVIEFVAANGTRRGVIARLYERYNAGNRDRAMLDVIESSEASYETVTLSECVNPVIMRDGSPDFLAVARSVIKAGQGDALIAKALADVPKDRQVPVLADVKQSKEKRAQAALMSLHGYTSTDPGNKLSLFRANAAFYYYLSLGTDGACAASPELKHIAGVEPK